MSATPSEHLDALEHAWSVRDVDPERSLEIADAHDSDAGEDIAHRARIVKSYHLQKRSEFDSLLELVSAAGDGLEHDAKWRARD